MNANPRSHLLIFLLASIVVFFVGFRFGKRIEKLDKNYVSPTPMVTEEPTPTDKPTAFDTFKHDGCKLSFLYPKGMVKKSASNEATLTDNLGMINFSCDKEAVAAFAKEHPASSEGKMTKTAGQNVKLFGGKEVSTWSIFNTKSGSKIIFTVSKNLTDLVLKTLAFGK